MAVLQVFPKSEVIEIPSTPSTNKFVEELLNTEQIADGTVYYTLDQTAGIGQAGNSWESEPSKNLTATVVLKPEFLSATDQFYLTIVASLSVCQTVDAYLNNHYSQIKWPNDIYVNHNKIAGILIRNYVSANTISTTIAGIGLNINQTIFKEAPNAISLKILLREDFNIQSVLTKWHENLAYFYLRLQDNPKELLQLYLSRMYMRGIAANYLIENQIVNATIEGVDKYGLLVLYDKSGKKYTCGLKEIIYPPLG